jgi:hypothetical protein
MLNRRDESPINTFFALVLSGLLLLAVGSFQVLAAQGAPTDSTGVPKLREAAGGNVPLNGDGTPTWTQQLAFKTTRSSEPFVQALSADLGDPVSDHSQIRKLWTWSGVSFTGLKDSTTTVRVEALIVHNPTPVFIRLRTKEGGNLIANDLEKEAPIRSYFQQVLESAYSDQ